MSAMPQSPLTDIASKSRDFVVEQAVAQMTQTLGQAETL